MQQPELFKSIQLKPLIEHYGKTGNQDNQSNTNSYVGQTETISRTLKIEEDGDYWGRKIKPKIRLVGHWLERAGFRPGNRVYVTCVAPGVIELRSIDASVANETMSALSEQSNCPF